jgi:hypothetical protein
MLMGWLALMGAALCIDAMKLLWFVSIMNIRGGFTEQLGMRSEILEVGSLFLYGFGVIGVFHFLRLAWHCFFPKASKPPARRYRPPDEPPEAKACGVPVGPRRPRPLMARALAT